MYAVPAEQLDGMISRVCSCSSALDSDGIVSLRVGRKLNLAAPKDCWRFWWKLTCFQGARICGLGRISSSAVHIGSIFSCVFRASAGDILPRSRRSSLESVKLFSSWASWQLPCR